jgi:uncharacterized protein (DUF427 family)
MSAEPAPGFLKNPDHKVEIALHQHEMQALAAGREIARYPDRFYFPLADVDGTSLQDSDHTSYCPFKGKARYWHAVTGDGATAENAVWAYDEPYLECVELAGHVAFWGDKLVVEETAR